MTETKINKTEKKISKKEIMMIILFFLLLITLTLKSTLLDEVKNLTPEEQQFKDFVDYSVARNYDGILEDTHLLVYRVYDIEMDNKNEKAVLRYEDSETGEMVDVIQNGRYMASVRRYFLWILPIKQFSVAAEVQK